MSTDDCLEIPDLWPTDVTLPDVLSPATLLRYQAGQLRAKTRNLLEAEIETVPGENEVTIEFYVVAPALDRYRYLLFSVRHRPDLVYPATIVAECFRTPSRLRNENSVFHFVEFLIVPQSGWSYASEMRIRASQGY